VMRLRLLISTLLLALLGANSGASAMCAAYCLSATSAASAAAHHHQMEPPPISTSTSHHAHSRHHGAACAECPSTSEYGLSQQVDCAKFVQIQALKEASFSFDAPSGVVQLDVADTSAAALSLASHRQRFLFRDASPTFRSCHSASVSLRI
jgi:hypothetical protein